MLGGWAFAQDGRISGASTESPDDGGTQGVIATVEEAGTVTTDAAGNPPVLTPSLGNFNFAAMNDGYANAATEDGLAPSDTVSDPSVNVSSTGRKPWSMGNTQEQKGILSWETGVGKSYVIPALEIPTFLLLLNAYDRHAFPNEMEGGRYVYRTNLSTFWDHLVRGPWGIDRDNFAMNQLNHPYQGTIYHGFARSAGLGYWQSLLYDNAGSFLWETGGETTHPSINDQIASGFGGSFFGEALFRMSSLVLEGNGNPPGFWRQLGATILSPSAGINRFAYGDRFKPIFPSHDPATFWRLRFGASLKSDLNNQGVRSTSYRNLATADFSMSYGLPGKAGYSYTRPFDYFQFEFISLGQKDSPIEDVMVRGLLLGKDYELGDSYRGIWGLYGGYDYLAPHIFRVSSTSVSLGTTYQWWLSRRVALQGSALGGVGFAAAGNVRPVGARDYHYGVAPQGLLALRLIFGDRAMLDLTDRYYHVTGQGGGDSGGRETINRLNMGFTVRIQGRNALGIQYITSSRNASYPSRADSHQTIGTVALTYTLLGAPGFGAVH